MDETLNRAIAGDAQAFAQLYERERDSLWRVCRSIMQNDDAAADALQEALLRIWKGLPDFKEQCSARTWMTRIVLNVCFDERRRSARETPADMVGTSHEPVAAAWEPFSNRSIDVQQALARLSDEDRAVLALFYAEDLPICDVALALDATEGAVRTRLSRARTRFKAIYRGESS